MFSGYKVCPDPVLALKMISVSSKMIFEEVGEKSWKTKVEKSGHPVKRKTVHTSALLVSTLIT